MKLISERYIFWLSEGLRRFFVIFHPRSELFDERLERIYDKLCRCIDALRKSVPFCRDPWGAYIFWTPGGCSVAEVGFDDREFSYALPNVANFGDHLAWEIVEERPSLFQFWWLLKGEVLLREFSNSLWMPKPSREEPSRFDQLDHGNFKLKIESELSPVVFGLKHFLVKANLRGRPAIGYAGRDERYKASYQRLPFFQFGKVNRSPQAQPYGQNGSKHERGDGREARKTRFHGETLQTSLTIVERVAA